MKERRKKRKFEENSIFLLCFTKTSSRIRSAIENTANKQHYARSSCEAPTHQFQVTQEGQPTQEQRQSIHKQELLIPPLNNNEVKHYIWGRYRDIEFEENVTLIYEQTVYWTKNLFLLPTRKAGKLFID